MSWHWKPEGLTGATEMLEALATEFPDQASAESWLTDTYPQLLQQGVREVSLYEEDRLVYGPMSLEPE